MKISIEVEEWTDHFGDKWLVDPKHDFIYNSKGYVLGYRVGKMALIYPKMSKYTKN